MFGVGGRLLDQYRVRVQARIGAHQARLVGQQLQTVGFDQVGNQCRQRVVVAKSQFVRSNGVVLVDHRHHPGVQQRAQRAACIQVAASIRQIVMGQQHQRHVQVVAGKSRFVRPDQPGLAHRRRRLQPV